MTWWDALILGFVQGATEFLPVSSSGHLVVAQELLHVSVQGVLFEVTVHVATLISIAVVYRARIFRLAAGALRGEGSAWRDVGLLVLATLPAAILGVAFEAPLEALFDNPWIPGVGFLLTGGLLWSTRVALRRDPQRRPGVRDALLIGVAQALALVPGVSRSGSTVVMALWLGIEAREAAAFSFLMALPAITGAAVLQIPALLSGPPPIPAWILLLGGLAAAVTGVFAIRAFLLLLRKRSFHQFALYVWILGVGYLLWLALTH